MDIQRAGISTDVSGRPLILLSAPPSDEWSSIFLDSTWSAAGMRQRPEIVNGSIGLPYMTPECVDALLPRIDHAMDVANKTMWLKEKGEPEGSP